MHLKLLKAVAAVVVVVPPLVLNLPAADLCQVEVGYRMPNLEKAGETRTDIVHWSTKDQLMMPFLMEAQTNLLLRYR